ncbi:hypothetical protein F5876DRAFT_66553 [Lentinula aff. lateritia]|uniref:Uncharacterized protein n=1 Tax=Lentinula aff. lateritia TaxID=2804960 RepID=A0ACC1TXM9_9AGAR|nr:hypothetical protein F5876DRAFT_66553 [Lentinula aff. lateritia]
MVALAVGATTLAGGFGISIYSTYLDLRYMWIEHKLARAAELLAKVEARRAAADRRCEYLEKFTSRSRQMTVEIERLQAIRMELVRVFDFNQLPTACAVTDDEDPAFEGYDVVLQKKETMRKIQEWKALERHLDVEMEWWHKEAEPEFQRRRAAQVLGIFMNRAAGRRSVVNKVAYPRQNRIRSRLQRQVKRIFEVRIPNANLAKAYQGTLDNQLTETLITRSTQPYRRKHIIIHVCVESILNSFVVRMIVHSRAVHVAPNIAELAILYNKEVRGLVPSGNGRLEVINVMGSKGGRKR